VLMISDRGHTGWIGCVGSDGRRLQDVATVTVAEVNRYGGRGQVAEVLILAPLRLDT